MAVICIGKSCSESCLRQDIQKISEIDDVDKISIIAGNCQLSLREAERLTSISIIDYYVFKIEHFKVLVPIIIT